MHGFLAILRKHILVEGRSKSFFALRTAGVACVAACCLVAIRLSVSPSGRGLIQGSAVFVTFAMAQMLILIPFAAIAGAYTVSREREDRTLPILLASGFRPLAIVGGLSVGRWVPIAVGLLAGLPIALLLLLFGGTTLEGVLIAYLLFFSTSVLAVGVASFISSFSSNPLRGAVGSIAVLSVLFFIIPLAPILPVSAPLVQEVLRWYAPLTALHAAASPYAEVTRLSLQGLTWALTGILLTILAAPATARPEAIGDRPSRRRARHLPLFGNPLTWPDMRRGGRMSRFLLLGILGLAVLMGSLSIATAGSMANAMLLTLTSGLVGFVVWIACLIYSIEAFGGWKRSGTLTDLLATPLLGRDIISAKSQALIRRLFPFILINAGVSLATGSGLAGMIPIEGGGYSLFTALNLINALAGLAVTAGLGMLFSLWTGSTVRAIIFTLGIQFVWGIVIGIVSLYIAMFSPFGMGGPSYRILSLQMIPSLLGNLFLCVIVWVMMVKYFDRFVGRCR